MNLPTDEERAEGLAEEKYPNSLTKRQKLTVTNGNCLRKGYAAAKLEDLKLMRDGMPFLQHADDCRLSQTVRGNNDCTCGLSTHLQQLEKLLGIQS